MSNTGARESGYLEVPGARLYYEVSGAGRPVVFLHADVANLRMWDEQVRTFAGQHRVITYDKRGFGKTTSEDGSFSPIADLAALLAHLGVERTSVVGLSNGGVLALDFTLAHPELVEALVVAAGFVSGAELPSTKAEEEQFGQYQTLTERGDTAGLIELGVRVWCDGPNQPEGRAAQAVREQIRQTLTENYRDHHEKLEPQGLEPPAVGRLGEVRVPTLAMLGEFDESATNAAMRLLAEGVAGAKLATFENCAHMINLEYPERFNALVGEVLSALPA